MKAEQAAAKSQQRREEDEMEELGSFINGFIGVQGGRHRAVAAMAMDMGRIKTSISHKRKYNLLTK